VCGLEVSELGVDDTLLQGSKDRVLEGALLEDGVGSCVS
jgi:hypothetical protein